VANRVVPMTRRVLVVDDDELLREVAQTALELVGGWEVLTAQSGPQAHRQALAEHPDAILLDVMMPGVDGPSTVAALRADPATRDIPIIFLTAKMPSEDLVEEWRPLRLAGVIPKPFDPMTLAADMASLLGWAEATR
jgi:CheY-like chemotaxis protein